MHEYVKPVAHIKSMFVGQLHTVITGSTDQLNLEPSLPCNFNRGHEDQGQSWE